jgi:patatin-like phospholipase/acyl hydrolase
MYRGGMRGIVILEVLNRVQNQLGHIQIQEFFDLIVGTRLVGIYSCPIKCSILGILIQFVAQEVSWRSVLG